MLRRSSAPSHGPRKSDVESHRKGRMVLSTETFETCPNCRSHFEARTAIVDLGNSGLSTLPDIPPRVRCPKCGHIFPAQTFRYFRFVRPRALLWALVATALI